MTTAIDRDSTQWSAMPGWGIFADLMPPELMLSRQLQRLRKALIAFLVIVVLACAAIYVYALGKHSSASTALDNAEAETAVLAGQQGSYSDVTQLRSTVSQIQAQVAAAMADDVDVAKLITAIRDALPATMSITSINITVSPTGGAVAAAGAAPAGGTQIGTVAITGSGQSITDLSSYVLKLAALPGVVNVVPNTNAATGRSTTFNLTLGVTSALYTHQYAVKAGN
jgi:Tfp pilus assembly protein PilN